ncbi:MAG TPA: tyrosine-type recombinase/integrase [Candidatus Methylacidiphilales bacterium]
MSPAQLRLALRLLKGRHKWRNRALLILGCRTGMRVSELLALQAGQIWDGSKIRSRIYLDRRDTKGKTYGASIVLHPRAAAALDKWIRSRGQVSPGDWLFPSQRSKDRPMRRVTAWRALHDAFVAAGVNGKSGTHCMRKTFAANVHRALGGDLFRLAKAMRHTSPLTTLAYLSFRQEEIDRATGLRRGRFVLSL